jgi:formate dehydrogenase subunit delta
MIHNANQIALFFATYPRDEAVAGIANHISKFWERRMRHQIEEYVAGGGGLHELVLEAAALKSCCVATANRGRHRHRLPGIRHRGNGRQLIQRSIWFKCLESLVRMRGLEPPLPCENMNLNHARLPIPPHPLDGWDALIVEEGAAECQPELSNCEFKFS